MIAKNHDNRFGFVSGFRHNNGSYQLEYYSAAIIEDLCSEGLCVAGQGWPELDSNEVSPPMKNYHNCTFTDGHWIITNESNLVSF